MNVFDRTMRWLLLLLLLACCASCQHPRRQSSQTVTVGVVDGDEIRTLSLPEFEGALYFFQTAQSALAKTPRWRPQAEFPPLSPRKAEAAALQRAQQIRPDVRKWRRESISLHESGDGDWYYLVTFWRGDIAIAGLPYFLQVPVLMDGHALPATINPKKK
jgi:hypothetical protein